MHQGRTSQITNDDSGHFWGRLLDAALVMALIAGGGGLPYLLSDDITVSRVALGGFAAAMLAYSVGVRLVLHRAVQAEMQRRRQAFFIAGIVIAPIYLYGVHRDGGLHSPIALTLLPAAALAAAAFPWRDARWHLLPMVAGYGLLAATTDDLRPWRAVWGLAIGLSVVVPVMMIRRGTLQYTTDQERSTSMLRVELAIDALTGCLNHRAFHEHLAEQPGGVRSSDQRCVAVLDVDHFKRINDTHGHLRGDDVLRDLGNVLRTTVRTSDLVGRIGGEEFAVLLPDTTLDEARQLAERIRVAVRDARPGDLAVTISCGVAQHRPGTTLTTALNEADAQLYRAKADGRDRVIG